MENFQSLPFLTQLLNQRYEKNVTIPATIIPARYGINILVSSVVFAKSLTPKIIVPTLTGKYNMNVYFRAVSLFKLQSRQATKTVPLRDIPGTIVTA